MNLVDADQIKSFDRLDRMRILVGAPWCNCGESCDGVVSAMSYRDIAGISGMNYSLVQNLATDQLGSFSVPTRVISELAAVSGLAPEIVVRVLHPISVKP